MHSMSYHYLVGVSTISHIIGETCEAIWNSICQEVMPPSKTTEEWLHIAEEFEERWNFNHCIGAIDGKHVIIEVMLFFFNLDQYLIRAASRMGKKLKNLTMNK